MSNARNLLPQIVAMRFFSIVIPKLTVLSLTARY